MKMIFSGHNETRLNRSFHIVRLNVTSSFSGIKAMLEKSHWCRRGESMGTLKWRSSSEQFSLRHSKSDMGNGKK